MLTLEEFITLYLNADEETTSFVESVLEQSQPSTDYPE